MNTCVLEDTQQAPLVMMGHIELIEGDQSARAVLGSCIGLAIIDKRSAVSALAHIVLPEACDRSGSPGKFADSAIPEMLKLLTKRNVARNQLTAKFAGGAEMFEKLGPLRIGEENVRAVTSLLEKLDIPVLGNNVGGSKGRRVSCTAKGEYTVEILGQSPVVL